MLHGDGLASVLHWLGLLAGADLVDVVTGALTFEFVMEV